MSCAVTAICCMIWRFFPLPGIIGISPPYPAYIALLQASFVIQEHRRIRNHDFGAFSSRPANRTTYDADMEPCAGIARTDSILPHWHNTVESKVVECHQSEDHGSWTAFDECGAGSSRDVHNIHNRLAGDWSDQVQIVDSRFEGTLVKTSDVFDGYGGPKFASQVTVLLLGSYEPCWLRTNDWFSSITTCLLRVALRLLKESIGWKSVDKKSIVW